MQEKTLLSYWLVLYQKKTIILLITVTSVITVLILGAVLPSVYEAKALFYVPSTSPSLSYLSTSTQGFARDKLVPIAKEDDAGPYIGLLKSKTIAEKVHEDFPEKSVRKLMLFDVDFELTNEFLIRVSSRDPDPVVAAGVANAYLKYFNQILQEASLNNPNADKSLLKEQLVKAEKNLNSAKNELKIFEEKHNIASLSEEIKNLNDQKTLFQIQHDNTIVLINENNEKIKSITEQLAKEKLLLSENDLLLTNSTIETYQIKLAEISAQIAAITTELKESHPDVKTLRNQHKNISDNLKKEVQSLLESQIKPTNTFYEQLRQNLINLIIERNKILATRKANNEVIGNINERLKQFPRINSEWGYLTNNVEHFKQVFVKLRMDLQEVSMQQARSIEYAVVVDAAKPPQSPSFPIIWLNVLIALMFGLSLSIFYAFFINYVEKTRAVRTLRIVKAVLSETER